MGASGRVTISDSLFIYWELGEPAAIPIKSVIKIDSSKLSVKTGYSNEIAKQRKINIYQIDSRTRLTVFETSDSKGKTIYNLYIPKESMKYFDMIVNYSSSMQPMEFQFEVIDHKKISKHRLK
tara:strand:- start:1583 stop:1951 length:369 start_codon:yes stop_codon:yes gene_type:complete